MTLELFQVNELCVGKMSDAWLIPPTQNIPYLVTSVLYCTVPCPLQLSDFDLNWHVPIHFSKAP